MTWPQGGDRQTVMRCSRLRSAQKLKWQPYFTARPAGQPDSRKISEMTTRPVLKEQFDLPSSKEDGFTGTTLVKKTLVCIAEIFTGANTLVRSIGLRHEN